MNYRFFFNLVTIPTLIGSLFAITFLANQVSAKEVAPSTTTASCDSPATPLSKLSSYHYLNQQRRLLIASSDSSILDFSSAESDAAATLFGCDCPSCISALRQLRSQPSANQGQGHCWAAVQSNFSPQGVQEVLNILETEEKTTTVNP